MISNNLKRCIEMYNGVSFDEGIYQNYINYICQAINRNGCKVVTITPQNIAEDVNKVKERFIEDGFKVEEVLSQNKKVVVKLKISGWDDIDIKEK